MSWWQRLKATRSASTITVTVPAALTYLAIEKVITGLFLDDPESAAHLYEAAVILLIATFIAHVWFWPSQGKTNE